jgi:16S rRNA (cytidine1402-2'-O)-methyltransferase
MSRGEIVIVVAGNSIQASTLNIDADRLLRALLEDLPPSQAAKIAAKISGEKRSELYERAVEIGARSAVRGPQPE